MPDAPRLALLPKGAVLHFEGQPGLAIETGVGPAQAAFPESWLSDSELVLGELGEATVVARYTNSECLFVQPVSVTDDFEPSAGQPGSTAVEMANPGFVGWAVEVSAVAYGDEVLAEFRTPQKALGAATGNSLDTLTLGNGGTATLRFEPPIQDGPGPDLAVFENGVNDTFLELAFVEVSSDSEHFLRFPCAALTPGPVGEFGPLDPTTVTGLAGKYRHGFGVPFDLSDLASHPDVQAGLTDLGAIGWVRIVDIVGDGQTLDTFGHPIYDPWPNKESAGFDLDAVGALHQAP